MSRHEKRFPRFRRFGYFDSRFPGSQVKKLQGFLDTAEEARAHQPPSLLKAESTYRARMC